MMLSLNVTLRYDKGSQDESTYNGWQMPLQGGCLDYIEWLFSCAAAPLPACVHATGCLMSLFFPPAVIFRTYWTMQSKPKPSLSMQEGVFVGIASISWLGFIICLIAEIADPSIGFVGLAFFFYCFFVTIVVAQRYEVRTMYNIEGGSIRDALAAFFIYYQVIWQANQQVQQPLSNDPEKQPIGQAIGKGAEETQS